MSPIGLCGSFDDAEMVRTPWVELGGAPTKREQALSIEVGREVLASVLIENPQYRG